MKKLYMKFDKLVGYWNPLQGAGVTIEGERDAKQWGIDVSGFDGYIIVDKEEDVQQAFLDYVNKFFSGKVEASHFDIPEYGDGRVRLCVTENGKGDMIMDNSTSDEQLFICDYDIALELHEVTTPSDGKLIQMFPDMGR